MGDRSLERERKNGGWSERENEQTNMGIFAGSLPKCLQQLELGQAKAGSPELGPGLPREWQVAHDLN